MIVAAPVQAAQSGRSAHFDIPAQGLAAAIDQFARQAGIQILKTQALLAGDDGDAAKQALDRLAVALAEAAPAEASSASSEQPLK